MAELTVRTRHQPSRSENGNEARPDEPFHGDISKSEGRKIKHVFMEISIFEEKKNKRRTKLGCVYINMEMKAVSRALSPPHGQPRSPAPSSTGSPFAVTCARTPRGRHPLPSSGSGSARSSLLFFSKALLYIQQPVGFAKWQPVPQPRCRWAHRWCVSRGTRLAS